MFPNLKYLTLMLMVAWPLTVDAQQHRGRAQQRGQSGQQRAETAQPRGQGGHQRADTAQPRGQSGHQRAETAQQRARNARAEALARPKQLADTLLPAGARRTPTTRFDAPHDRWNRWPHTNQPRWKNRRFNSYPFGQFGQGYGSYYAVPYSGFYPGTSADEDTYDEPAQAAAVATNKGVLQLDITPASGLDYYVDGIYIGSSSNLGSEFEINAGARQIEIRSRGYKPATFDTRIDEGRVTTVRGVLEPLEQPQAPRNPGSRMMYVIPGCYMGNARPAPSALPPGCDVKKMVTRGGGL